MPDRTISASQIKERHHMTLLTRMTETSAPEPRPTDRKNDIAAPATSTLSLPTRLTHIISSYTDYHTV